MSKSIVGFVGCAAFPWLLFLMEGLLRSLQNDFFGHGWVICWSFGSLINDCLSHLWLEAEEDLFGTQKWVCFDTTSGAIWDLLVWRGHLGHLGHYQMTQWVTMRSYLGHFGH